MNTTKNTKTKTLKLKLTAKLLFTGRRAFIDNTSEVITDGPKKPYKVRYVPTI